MFYYSHWSAFGKQVFDPFECDFVTALWELDALNHCVVFAKTFLRPIAAAKASANKLEFVRNEAFRNAQVFKEAQV